MRLRMLIPAAAVLIGACNKKLEVSDPYSGPWSVVIPAFADSTYLAPANFTLNITNVGTSYAGALPDLVYHKANGDTVGTYAVVSDSTRFLIDSVGVLTLHLGGPGTCVLTMTGPLLDGLGNGFVSLASGCGQSATESVQWSAAKR